MGDKEQQQEQTQPQQQPMTEEEKRLEQVRECGRLAMGIEDVAVVIGLPLCEVYADFDERGELYQAYRAGQVETKMELRSARLQEAKKGDLEAGEEIMRLIREINIEQYGTNDEEEEAGDEGPGEGGDAGEHHDH
jgi:hypothetical protein